MGEAKLVPGAAAHVAAVFRYMATGWIVVDGVAVQYPGLMEPAYSHGPDFIELKWPPGITVRITAGAVGIVLPFQPHQMEIRKNYAIPPKLFNTLIDALSGRDVSVNADTKLRFLGHVIPKVQFDGDVINLQWPPESVRATQGALWAWVRGIRITPTGGEVDVYRGVLGWDVARNPTFVWGQ